MSPALITAIVSLISSISGLIALFRHTTGPWHKP